MGHLCQLFTYVSVSLGTLTVVKGDFIHLVLGRKGTAMSSFKIFLLFCLVVLSVALGIILAPLLILATKKVATKIKTAKKEKEDKAIVRR